MRTIFNILKMWPHVLWHSFHQEQCLWPPPLTLSRLMNVLANRVRRKQWPRLGRTRWCNFCLVHWNTCSWNPELPWRSPGTLRLLWGSPHSWRGHMSRCLNSQSTVPHKSSLKIVPGQLSDLWKEASRWFQLSAWSGHLQLFKSPSWGLRHCRVEASLLHLMSCALSDFWIRRFCEHRKMVILYATKFK